ncbi:hypothetical protein [Micromonospora sp. NPDC004551]|uniref:hypothetical protein n=1 Tax=Micromonospora sp. NPDC004551 TaxID=3154284 RepID=UPI00339F7B7F
MLDMPDVGSAITSRSSRRGVRVDLWAPQLGGRFEAREPIAVQSVFQARPPDRDAIDNDIEIVGNAEHVLVYAPPIGAEGIRWRDFQDWWNAIRRLDSDEQAKTQPYRRLRQSLPANSPPQQRSAGVAATQAPARRWRTP